MKEDQQLLYNEAYDLIWELEELGFRSMLTGGYVRDDQLGRPFNDIDIVTEATPDELEKLFPKANLVGKSFGVVIATTPNGLSFDIATLRADGVYSDGRHPDVVKFTKDFEEDSQRRDFTINAMYEDTYAEVWDYHNGLDDLKNKQIRCVGDPNERFYEDPLRMLRAIRFASELSFDIELNTYNAIVDNSDDVSKLSGERVRQEVEKILMGPKPALGIGIMQRTGLLRVLSPELDKMLGCTQPPEYHPEGDVWTHVLMMLLDFSDLPEDKKNANLAWATLLHDVGKPPTREVDENGRIRFNGHDAVGAKITKEILERLKFPNKATDEIVHLVKTHMQFISVQKMKNSSLKRFMAIPYIENMLALHKMDCEASNDNIENYYFIKMKQQQFKGEKLLPKKMISGKFLLDLGMQPNKSFGAALSAIYDKQLNGDFECQTDAEDYARRTYGEN